MIIVYHKEFLKRYKKLPVKTREKFKQRLDLFIQDEFDPSLNNHALAGKYLGYRSINITGNIRAIFKRTNSEAVFVTIGTHSRLYG